MNELDTWGAKFEAYMVEPSSVNDILSQKKTVGGSGGARANSAANRLYK